jgi:hypothetical protein
VDPLGWRKGSGVHLVSEVNEFINQLDEIVQNVRNESEDLEQFLTGKRTSQHPLGAKFLLNRGHELQQLQSFVEQALKKVAAR